MRATKQTWRALQIWPSAGRWKSAVGITLPAVAIIALSGYLGGWLYFNPVGDIESALVAAIILFFVPALAEELIFRGLLLATVVSVCYVHPRHSINPHQDRFAVAVACDTDPLAAGRGLEASAGRAILLRRAKHVGIF